MFKIHSVYFAGGELGLGPGVGEAENENGFRQLIDWVEETLDSDKSAVPLSAYVTTPGSDGPQEMIWTALRKQMGLPVR